MAPTPRFLKVRPSKPAPSGMRALEAFGFSSKKVVRWSRPPIRLSTGQDPWVVFLKEVSKPPQINATDQAWDTLYQDYWGFWTNVAQYVGIFQGKNGPQFKRIRQIDLDGRHAHREWSRLKAAYLKAYKDGKLSAFHYAREMNFLRDDWRFHSHDKRDRERGGKFYGRRPLV